MTLDYLTMENELTQLINGDEPAGALVSSFFLKVETEWGVDEEDFPSLRFSTNSS